MWRREESIAAIVPLLLFVQGLFEFAIVPLVQGIGTPVADNFFSLQKVMLKFTDSSWQKMICF
jgi:hypothetical protein